MVVIVVAASADTFGLPYLRRSRKRYEPFVPSLSLSSFLFLKRQPKQFPFQLQVLFTTTSATPVYHPNESRIENFFEKISRDTWGWQIATGYRRFDTFLSGAIKAPAGPLSPLFFFAQALETRYTLNSSRRYPRSATFSFAPFFPTLGHDVYIRGGKRVGREILSFERTGARERSRDDARGTWNSGSGCLRRPLT